jgi:hypothetical protein
VLLEIQSDAGGSIRASVMSWSMLLWLARDAGWAGAEALMAGGRARVPEPGERVELGTEATAAFAAALEAALPDVPGHDAMLHKVAWSIDFPAWVSSPHAIDHTIDGPVKPGAPAWRPAPTGPAARSLVGQGPPGWPRQVRYLRSQERITPFEYFSGSNKTRLVRLISLLGGGGISVKRHGSDTRNTGS